MDSLKKTLAKPYIALCIILIFSFLIRLYYLFNIPHPPLIADAHHYDVMAKQFLKKGFLGYSNTVPDAYITPGYPVFLAIIYKLFGYSQGSPLMQVRIIQIILSTFTTLLLYLLAQKISNHRVGLLSAFFSSIYLISMWVPTLILTETLYTFLFMLYLYIQIIALYTKSIKLNFISGMFLALAVLVRPLIAPFIVLPYIYYYIKEKDRQILKLFLVNAIGFVLVMLPWWIRNLITFHKLIFFATQEDPLLRGTYPYDIGVENIPYFNQKQEALKRIKEGFSKQTWLYLKWYTIGKFDWLYFKIFYYVDDKIKMFRSLLPLHYFFVTIGWVGVAFSAISNKLWKLRFLRTSLLCNKGIGLISLYVTFITLAHLLFVATSRYSYPQMYLLMLLTAYITDTLFSLKQNINKNVI